MQPFNLSSVHSVDGKLSVTKLQNETFKHLLSHLCSRPVTHVLQPSQHKGRAQWRARAGVAGATEGAFKSTSAGAWEGKWVVSGDEVSTQLLLPFLFECEKQNYGVSTHLLLLVCMRCWPTLDMPQVPQGMRILTKSKSKIFSSPGMGVTVKVVHGHI